MEVVTKEGLSVTLRFFLCYGPSRVLSWVEGLRGVGGFDFFEIGGKPVGRSMVEWWWSLSGGH